MSKVSQKYLKNRNKEVFSPIISPDSVYLEDKRTLKTILDNDKMELYCFKGETSTVRTNGTAVNPTSKIYYNNNYISVLNSRLRFKAGFYQIVCWSRYNDISNANADCSQSLSIYNSSGKPVNSINIWEKNYKRLTTYLDVVVEIPENGYIMVDTYNDNNLDSTTVVSIYINKM